MRIPVRLDRRLSSAPGPVFDALRHAGLWRESEIPDAARTAGIRSLEVTTRGHRFAWKLYLSRSRGRYAPPSPQLRGRVAPDGVGTRVVAECRRSRMIFVMPILISLPLLPGAWERELSITTVLIVSAFWIVSLWYYTSADGDYERDAEFLLGRFEDILARFEQSPSRGNAS